jgi:hypothetical protein
MRIMNLARREKSDDSSYHSFELTASYVLGLMMSYDRDVKH